MKAVILAGGKGERLRPLTYAIPKPLLPIKEKPIIHYILSSLKKHGFTEVILCVGYLAYQFENLLGDGKDYGLKITYSKEPKPLGTAGPIKEVEDQLEEDFLVINGDVLTDLDFSELMNFHKSGNHDLTVVTKEHSIRLDYGMVETQEDNVIGWSEKPTLKREISTGIAVLKPKILSYIDKGEAITLPEVIIRASKKEDIVKRFLYEGRWIDIGKIGEYERAQSEELSQFEK